MRDKGEPKGEVRVKPPSDEANNQDVFIWALYLLGGADADVDVEAVYLKSFELAPARLGWRTRPDLPDYKKTAKALQSVESSTHVGLVQWQGPYARRLTAEGVRWVERNIDILRSTYEGHRPVPGTTTGVHERLRKRLRESNAFSEWQQGQPLDLGDLSDAFECSAASPAATWRLRLEEAKRVGHVLSDQPLLEFVDAAHSNLSSRGIL